MTPPRVSIVIPTRNGAQTLPALLDAIGRQRMDGPIEIVAIDSSSTDGSAELLRGKVDRLLSIPAGEFNHGLTRNRGIAETRGEFVVLMVQDAVPASDDCLARLVDPLIADDRVAGSFARQRPHAGAPALARYYLEFWAAGSDVPRTAEIGSRSEFDALTPRAQFDRCAFDNVCSCIRRSVWVRHPFPDTPIAEDIEWGRTVLLAGFKLAYAPEAAVFHSHDRGVPYELARTYALHRRLYELFGLRTIPTLPLLARATASSLATHLRFQRDLRSVGLAFAWPLGQYSGALAASRGWRLSKPAGV
jgi:rhamnosyltransferase